MQRRRPTLFFSRFSLQDNLDVYEKYAENPGQLSFITRILRSIIEHHRQIDFHVEPLFSAPR